MHFRNQTARSRAAHPLRQLSPHTPLQPPAKPAAAYRQRQTNSPSAAYSAPEFWYAPDGRQTLHVLRHPPGEGFIHPVTEQQVRDRLALLPAEFVRDLEVVQFSRMTRKRSAFPCYGMQWGQAIYLYPVEESLQETYTAPPKPAQQIEARQFGAEWGFNGKLWTLTWTRAGLEDFYLNNVLIHELGHLNDPRNTSYRDRERFANWFAIEYGVRASRNRS